MSLIKFSTRPTPPWFGDIDRWFDAAFAPACQPAREPAPGPVTRRFVPTVDIVEDEKKIVLKADLPGVNDKDIEVKLDDGVLTLSGERKFEKETKDETCGGSSAAMDRSGAVSHYPKRLTRRRSQPPTRKACSRSRSPR